MKRHFSYAELTSIESVSARLQTERNQPKSKSKRHRQRIRVRVIHAEAVTSSNRRTAFWINEYNTVNKIDTRSMPKKAYYKFFGKFIAIKDNQIQEYLEHGVEIIYK